MNSPENAGDIRDLPITKLGRSPGEGHGNPLQYSCLENPTDKGAGKATVHRVAKSQTQLKLLSTHVLEATKFSGGDIQGLGFSILEKNIRYWHKCKCFSLFLWELNLLWGEKKFIFYFSQFIFLSMSNLPISLSIFSCVCFCLSLMQS